MLALPCFSVIVVFLIAFFFSFALGSSLSVSSSSSFCFVIIFSFLLYLLFFSILSLLFLLFNIADKIGHARLRHRLVLVSSSLFFALLRFVVLFFLLLSCLAWECHAFYEPVSIITVFLFRSGFAIIFFLRFSCFAFLAPYIACINSSIYFSCWSCVSSWSCSSLPPASSSSPSFIFCRLHPYSIMIDFLSEYCGDFVWLSSLIVGIVRHISCCFGSPLHLSFDGFLCFFIFFHLISDVVIGGMPLSNLF